MTCLLDTNQLTNGNAISVYALGCVSFATCINTAPGNSKEEEIEFDSVCKTWVKERENE
jgi:hypothetical protein